MLVGGRRSSDAAGSRPAFIVATAGLFGARRRWCTTKMPAQCRLSCCHARRLARGLPRGLAAALLRRALASGLATALLRRALACTLARAALLACRLPPALFSASHDSHLRTGMVRSTDPPVDRRAWRSLVVTRSPYTASKRRVKLALQRAMPLVAVDGSAWSCVTERRAAFLKSRRSGS